MVLGRGAGITEWPLIRGQSLLSTSCLLNRIGVSVQELLGPLFCVVPNGGLGVCDALVKGKGERGAQPCL